MMVKNANNLVDVNKKIPNSTISVAALPRFPKYQILNIKNDINEIIVNAPNIITITKQTRFTFLVLSCLKFFNVINIPVMAANIYSHKFILTILSII